VLAALTSVPGASACIWGGCVVYADASKTDLLGVPEELVAASGAVSENVTRTLAERVKVLAGTTYGVSVTGWAGPEHGVEPAGTVYIAVAHAAGCECQRALYDGDRASVREQAVDAVLVALFEAQQEAH
jgi:nicotinamide-nucleotide amidase